MSSNPFRRSMPPAAVKVVSNRPFNNTPRSRHSFHAVDDVQPAIASSKTKKVRIASPPPSPPQRSDSTPESALIQRLSSPGYAGSPVPEDEFSSDSADDLPEDPFNRGADDRGESADGEQRIRSPSGRHGTTAGALQGTNAPANPFQRTLATMEPAPHGPLEQDQGGHAGNGAAERVGGGAARASLDVDAFKRLLMTGSAAPPSAGASTAGTASQKPVAGLTFDSSSSTDASSISKQSIFEPVHEMPESPRTPYDVFAFDDDEKSRLVDDNPKPESRKKPPPPKHRHGKLVSPRAPQTVSFDDFQPSFSSPALVSSSPPSAPSHSQLTRAELNKPLPPPPPTPASPDAVDEKEEGAETQPKTEQKVPEAQETQPSQSPVQKRTPPAPPLARRHSQLRSSTRNRSNSQLSLPAQLEESSSASPPVAAEATKSSKRPPPPPARRAAPSAATNSTPALPSTSASSSRRSTLSSQAPPALASAGPAAGRPPSVKGESSSAMGPPPPPPRRGSSRSSAGNNNPPSPGESRRASGEIARSSFDSTGKQPSFASSLRNEYPIAEKTHPSSQSAVLDPEDRPLPAPLGPPMSDILADMQALQREVDELRHRYSRRAS